MRATLLDSKSGSYGWMTHRLPVGTLGVVRGVDDTGSIMVGWETGGSLNVVYRADLCVPVITAERREEIFSRALSTSSKQLVIMTFIPRSTDASA